MSLVIDTKVVQNKQVIPGYCGMDLDAPAIAQLAKPGQFLHVRCGSTHDPLLRRPISIHAVDRQAGVVSLLYRLYGRGTALLAERRTGDTISIIGPLGRGFTMPRGNEKVFVVSGGIGIAPLYFLLQELAGLGIKAAVFLGFATANQVLLEKEIRRLGHSVDFATDDGTKGFCGNVIELFEGYLQNGSFAPGAGVGEDLVLHKVQTEQTSMDLIDAYNERLLATNINLSNCVFTCGPHGMMRKLSEIALKWGIPCEVSLEERMGCGVGACLSCACKTNNGNGISYRRVCMEGPVFPSGVVSWE